MNAAPAGRERASGGAAREPDRALVIRRVHELRARRRLAPQRAAQVADEPLAGGHVVEMDDLARERRAMAVRAAVAVRLVVADATPQEGALEWRPGLCGDTAEADRGHRPACFDGGARKPSKPLSGADPIDRSVQSLSEWGCREARVHRAKGET